MEEATGFYEAIEPKIIVGWEQGNIVSSIGWVEARLPDRARR